MTKIHDRKRIPWKYVSQAEFDMVKKLFEAGLTIGKICKVTKRGWGTLQYIQQSNTLEDYHKLVRDRFIKYEKTQKTQEVPPNPPEGSGKPPFDNEEITQVKMSILKQLDSFLVAVGLTLEEVKKTVSLLSNTTK